MVLEPTTAAKLPAALSTALRKVLAGLGVAEPLIAGELSRMDGCAFAKTASRSVVGSMTDFAFLMEAPPSEPESLTRLSLWLAQTPCTPLKMERPRDAVASVFRGK